MLFTEGDTVEVVRDGDSHFGHTGEIVYIERGDGHDPLYHVDLGDDYIGMYGDQDLDKPDD